MADLDAPIAVRRARRSNIGANEPTPEITPKVEPKTPRRTKKAVRFSDPGQYRTSSSSSSSSCGLTPFINRTSIGTPKRRRASTPAKSSGSGIVSSLQSGNRFNRQVALQHLRQTMEGRVERNIRRNNVRDLLNKLEQDKKRQAKASSAEITRLKAEVKSKDREIYELQNETVIIDTERIWDLEQQVEDLKKELRTRTDETVEASRQYDWTLAAHDPFADEFMDMSPDNEQFGDTTMGDFIAGTPSRGRNSFPTPPATSPCLPITPSSGRNRLMTPKSHAGVQVTFPDPAKKLMEDELASMKLELGKLTATLDSYKSLGDRLATKLSSVQATTAQDTASPIDILEQRIELLVQTMSDRTAALGQLSSSIGDLGFSGSDASEMISSLSSGFRAARLELEYLTPGEIALPLTSHGAEVLDLLLSKLRELAKKVKESDDSIDEYHEIEQSLRKQLDARVSVMEGLKSEMYKAERLMNEKNLKIKELAVGNDRLKGAVDGYIRDIKELEALVERIEKERQTVAETHKQQHETDKAAVLKKTSIIADLETKLADAVKQTEALQKEINKVEDSTTKHVVSMNKRHGSALALRDARVLELRGEIDRVNVSLRAAHETVRVLRVEKGGLKTRMEEEKAKAKAAMDAMKDELQRALQMSQEFLNTPKKARNENTHESERAATSSPSKSSDGVKRVAGFADPARRHSKMRRRHDSGMGLLEEDEVDF